MSSACEACGWAAAFCSMLAFGSFGVPIKSQAARSVDIDPLVFQSYKTFMCFATSWLVLWNVPFHFTPWGIVSGLFWVPGGVATVYAVKSAGLAIGIGIGSSFIVLVSFLWGIFVFQEKVHSKLGACFAIFCMMMGLMGMSYFSSPETEAATTATVVASLSDDQEDMVVVGQEEPPENLHRRNNRGIQYTGLGSHTAADSDHLDVSNGSREDGLVLGKADSTMKNSVRTAPTTYSDSFVDDCEETDLPCINDDDDPERDEILDFASGRVSCESRSHLAVRSTAASTTLATTAGNGTVVCGITITKRQGGMLSAMFCGVWGGSVLAPMKWSKADTKGTGFLISFAIGASIINMSLWVMRYLWNVAHYRSFARAFYSLPSFHLRVMWAPGGLSGLLWSIGNYFSLISVFYLGEGVGYPLVQTSILVSGLWGIFYFEEVKGTERVGKWILSSLLTICGILLLSYEHHASKQ